MAQVMIEGSQVTPCDRLGRGMRAKVELTDDIRKLVKIGAVIIVDQDVPDDLQLVHPDLQQPVPPAPPLPEQTWSPGDPSILPEVPESAYGPDSTPLDPVSEETQPLPGDTMLKAPPKNGATVDWQAWVKQNVPDSDIEGKSRDELIGIWEAASVK